MISNRYFRNQLRSLLIDRKISQKTAGQIAGVSEHTIGRWLNSKSLYEIQESNVKRLCDGFNVEVSFFIESNVTDKKVILDRLNELVLGNAKFIASEYQTSKKTAVTRLSLMLASQMRLLEVAFTESEKGDIDFTKTLCLIMNTLGPSLFRYGLNPSVQNIWISAISQQVINSASTFLHIQDAYISKYIIHHITFDVGNYSASYNAIKSCSDIAGRLGNDWLYTESTGHKGRVLLAATDSTASDLDEGYKLIERSWNSCISSGNVMWAAIWRGNMGRYQQRMGNLSEALECRNEEIHLRYPQFTSWRAADDTIEAFDCLAAISQTLALLGKPSDALECERKRLACALKSHAIRQTLEAQLNVSTLEKS